MIRGSSFDGVDSPDHEAPMWHRAPSTTDRELIRHSYIKLSTAHPELYMDANDTLEEHQSLKLDTIVRPPIKWWAWTHVGQFTGQRLLLWYVGFLFLIGAAFFTFVGITEVIPAIVIDDPNGYNSLTAWLVVYPTFIGAVGFFWTASLINLIEALNSDFDLQVASWRDQGGLGKPPRLKLIGAQPRSMYWWAALIQVMGTTSFGIASVYGIIGLSGCFATGGPAMVFVWCVYAFGGTCFAVAGWMFTYSVTNSWWKGYFPVKREHRQSLAYWSMWFYAWGALGFCLSGWFFFGSLSMIFKWYAFQQLIGYGLGSFFFFLSSYCVLLWISNPQSV